MKIALIDGDIVKTYIDTSGYEVTTTIPHLYVHRLKAEKALGRKLYKHECVHHIDGNKRNNNVSNLVICPDDSYHQLLHARTRIIELGGSPDTHKYCTYHRGLHENSKFSTRPSTWSGLHNMCKEGANLYRKTRGLNRNKFDWRARLNQQYRRIKSKYTAREISWINPREDIL